MIFSSVTFLFLFLPLVLALVSVSGRRYRNHVLLAASLFFYFWGEGVFTLLLIGSMLVNFCIAPALEQNSGKNRKLFLIIGVVLNLIPLFIFKYAGFFSEVFRPVLGRCVFRCRSIMIFSGYSDMAIGLGRQRPCASRSSTAASCS